MRPDDVGAPRTGLPFERRRLPQIFQVTDRRRPCQQRSRKQMCRPRIFIGASSGMKSSRNVGSRSSTSPAPPQKAHVRSEYLVSAANQIVAAKLLHINRPVRAVVHAIQKNFGAGRVGHFRDRGHIHDRAQRVRCHRAGHQPGPCRITEASDRPACRLPSSRIRHQTSFAPYRSSAAQVAMFAS